MKVLFAVNNENISEAIIKKYQQEYKVIISSKNVYYFNAIIKELQKDKSYDAIVISEDLETFSNNNYEMVDNFIFDKLDNISDEATNIPIILICVDRRSKSDSILVKLFGIGIYNALIGQDRSITNVCKLINKSRTKKEAKDYYRIDADDVNYKSESEGYVSEEEIQNILTYYKKLGKNEERYVDSFNDIATQYTDSQLRLICKFLPLNVRAVLEAQSPKYQQIVTFGTSNQTNLETANYKTNNYKTEYKPKTIKTTKNDYKPPKKPQPANMKIDLLEKQIGQSNIAGSVVIPTSVNTANVKKVSIGRRSENIETGESAIRNIKTVSNSNNSNYEQVQNKIIEQGLEPKKKRGRPRKIQSQEDTILPGIIETEVGEEMETQVQEPVKRKRGRPRKIQPQEEPQEQLKDEVQEEINLFDLGNEEEINNEHNAVPETTGGMILPGFEDYEEEDEDDQIISNRYEQNNYEKNYGYKTENTNNLNNEQNYYEQNTTKQLENTNSYRNADISHLLSRDKKIVAFVGTSKNGTSFLVNNLAEEMSQKGIKTAILDLTQNKNAYYIYTENEEELRKKAYASINNLKNGIPEGIPVNKNLSVFTNLPGENAEFNDYSTILETLVKNYSLVLLDCDFETNFGYFDCAQEIYLVQTLDVLTIQPLTAFLRDLKSKNILNPQKLKIVLNKVLRVRSITEKTIIGGMAFYNDPAMSFMTELFNKDTVEYCVIPFEEQTYSKYLEGLVNCKISTSGYSKNFMMSLSKLSNMVYPLISENNRANGRLNQYNNYETKNNFSNNINNTLNKMKRNY